MTKQPLAKVTARNLLHGFLELRGLSPNLADWSEERLSGNPPRLFRLRQLIALFEAFEITWSPSSFIEGKFIEPESPRYVGLLEKMDAAMPGAREHGLLAHPHQLPACFEIILKYRERVEKVLTFSGCFLEANGLCQYALMKAGELDRIIRGNIGIIDDLLVAFISPESNEFTVDDLARNYSYPDVDLLAIDADWY